MKKSGIVKNFAAAATAKALIKRSSLEHLKEFNTENSSLAKSLVKQMGFVKRPATTGKPESLDRCDKTPKYDNYFHQIVDLTQENNIPPLLILNLTRHHSNKHQ